MAHQDLTFPAACATQGRQGKIMTDNILPELPGVSRGEFLGRNPYEGYQRASGLKFTDLPDKIFAQSDYQAAFALAESRTVCLGPRLLNLYLLIRYFLPKLKPGAILEFGSYRGGSAMFMAKLAQIHLPGTQVYALDTFGGMPSIDPTIDSHHAGDFADTAIEEIAAAKDAAGLGNLHLVKGLFDQTTPSLLRTCGPVALAHIDCDIYHPAIYAWEQVAPVMVPGGYIVFDDATEASCLGATQAVEDIVARYGVRSEQIDPHYVFRYPPPGGRHRSRIGRWAAQVLGHSTIAPLK
jgi:hypothetical protein